MTFLTRIAVSIGIAVGGFAIRTGYRYYCAVSGPKQVELIDESAEERGGTADFQLLDDSVLLAKISPWPPVVGNNRVHVEIGLDDGDTPFNGTLECRLALAENSKDRWYPVTGGKRDAEGLTTYDFPIKLRPGIFWLEFRTHEPGDSEPSELTGWKIPVQ